MGKPYSIWRVRGGRIMQEEVNQKTIAFTTQNAKITARVLKEII